VGEVVSEEEGVLSGEGVSVFISEEDSVIDSKAVCDGRLDVNDADEDLLPVDSTDPIVVELVNVAERVAPDGVMVTDLVGVIVGLASLRLKVPVCVLV
jgi:hypothetical protein